MLTDTISKTFDDLFATVNENTDAVVRSSQVVERAFGASGEVRARVDEYLIEDGRAPWTESPKPRARRRLRTDRRRATVTSSGTRPGPPDVRRQLGRRSTSSSRSRAPRAAARGAGRGGDRPRQRQGRRATRSVTRCRSERGRPPASSRLTGVARFGDADSPGGATFAHVDHRGRAGAVGRARQGRAGSAVVAPTRASSQAEVVGASATAAQGRRRRRGAHRPADHRGDARRHPGAAVVLHDLPAGLRR